MTTQTSQNVKRVAGTLFIVFALIDLGAYLLGMNQFQTSLMQIIVNLIDLPIYLFSTIYFATSVIQKLGYTEMDHMHKALAIWILTLTVFASITILDLFANQFSF